MNTIIKQFLLVIALSMVQSTYAQNMEWAKSMGGANNEKGTSIAIDAVGNVYTVGFFQGTVDFDPNSGTENLSSAGSNDIFITKQDEFGNLIWARNIGGGQNDIATSLAVDASGNAFVTGFFSGTVNFDPCGTSTLTAQGADAYLLKINSTGCLDWVKQFGGSGTQEGKAVTLDDNGNIFLTGYYTGSTDFDPNNGTTVLTSNGNTDIFIEKLDPSGNLVWVKSIGGSAGEQGLSIAVDNAGSVYTTGFFSGSVDFDPGTGSNVITSNGGYDIYIHKLDLNGNFQWAKKGSGSGTSYDYGRSVIVDSNDDVYVTGSFNGFGNLFGVNISGDGIDAFLFKFDPAGNTIWYGKIGGLSSQYGRSLSYDGSGNIYLAGTFQGSPDFDINGGVTSLTSLGGNDAFIEKFDPAGNIVWVKQLGGSSDDVAASIDVNSSGDVHTTGDFQGTADFDPNTGVFNLNSSGNSDIFVHKLSCNAVGTDVQMQCGSFTWIDGNTYTSSNNTANYTFTGGAANGCDSIVTLDLTIYTPTGTDVQTACDSYTWIDGNTYTSSNNTATHTLTTSEGCDSIVTLDLTIYTPSGTDEQSACGSYTWIDGNTYTSSNNTATYTLTTSEGCDSIVTLDLTIIDTPDDQNVTASATSICSGSNVDITIDGSESGVKYYLRDDSDNTVIAGPVDGNGSSLNLNTGAINSSTTYNVYAEYSDYGVELNSNNDFVQFLNPAQTTYSNEITIEAWVYISSFGEPVWAGQSFPQVSSNTSWIWLWHGSTFYVNNLGSVVAADLPNLQVGWNHIATVAKSNGLYVYYNGVLVDSTPLSGLNMWGLTNTVIDLGHDPRYPPGNANIESDVIFDEFRVWNTAKTGTEIANSYQNCLFGNETGLIHYTKFNEGNGTAVNSETGVNGSIFNGGTNNWVNGALSCDTCTTEMSSTVTINVNSAVNGVDTQTACDSYTWIDGNTYTSSNNTATYTISGGAVSGCDSIVTLDLTLTNSTSGVDVQSACNSFTWIDGNTYTSSNNTATHTLTNSVGCDSVVTLDLTINSSTGTDVQHACNSYTWIDGNTYTSSNNTATYTLTNSAGCDSVVTLDLTINGVSDITTNTQGSTITANNTNATYQWLDCINGNSPINGANSATFTATQNGEYAVELTENGCVDTSACVSIMSVGIEQNLKGYDVIVYPNPATNVINVVNSTNTSALTVEIFDVNGRVVVSDDKALENSTEGSISIDHLETGIYTLRVYGENGQKTFKIVKK